MRNFFAIIAAVMRSMGSFTARLIKRAGKWVSELVRVPAAPAAAEAADAVPNTEPSKANDLDAIRELAKVMATGRNPEAEMLRGLPPRTVKWLAAMDRAQLVKVILAKDTALAAHMRGGAQTISGLVPYDVQAIDDVAKAKSEPRPRDRKPTFREMLESNGVSLAA